MSEKTLFSTNVEPLSTKFSFMEWLINGPTVRSLDKKVIIPCIDRVSQYAMDKKICSASLWEYDNHLDFQFIYDKLLDSKMFRFMKSELYSTFRTVGLIYLEFLREKETAKPAAPPPTYKPNKALETKNIADKVKQLQSAAAPPPQTEPVKSKSKPPAPKQKEPPKPEPQAPKQKEPPKPEPQAPKQTKPPKPEPQATKQKEPPKPEPQATKQAEPPKPEPQAPKQKEPPKPEPQAPKQAEPPKPELQAKPKQIPKSIPKQLPVQKNANTDDSPEVKDANLKKIIAEYCKIADTFTLDELLAYEKEQTGTVHNRKMAELAHQMLVRIDKETYTTEKTLTFDCVYIDYEIKKFIQTTANNRQYLLIKSFNNVADFPDCGKPWNLFLLESYCQRFSKMFTIKIPAMNAKNVGVVAFKDCKLDYNEILADVIARANISLETLTVIRFLHKNGYTNKLKIPNIAEIIQEAAYILANP